MKKWKQIVFVGILTTIFSFWGCVTFSISNQKEMVSPLHPSSKDLSWVSLKNSNPIVHIDGKNILVSNGEVIPNNSTYYNYQGTVTILKATPKEVIARVKEHFHMNIFYFIRSFSAGFLGLFILILSFFFFKMCSPLFTTENLKENKIDFSTNIEKYWEFLPFEQQEDYQVVKKQKKNSEDAFSNLHPFLQKEYKKVYQEQQQFYSEKMQKIFEQILIEQRKKAQEIFFSR